jgi:hypothetical protein
MRETSVARGFRFATILSVLLVLILAAPGVASGKPGKTSQVADEFNGQAPPREIECVWNGGDHTYWCSGDNYRVRLSTLDGDGGLLVRGGNPPGWDWANPEDFSCTGPQRAPVDVRPSDFRCSYGHRHDQGRRGWHRHHFRMHEMMVMTDPDPDPNAPAEEPIDFVWPPHK